MSLNACTGSIIAGVIIGIGIVLGCREDCMDLVHLRDNKRPCCVTCTSFLQKCLEISKFWALSGHKFDDLRNAKKPVRIADLITNPCVPCGCSSLHILMRWCFDKGSFCELTCLLVNGRDLNIRSI